MTLIKKVKNIFVFFQIFGPTVITSAHVSQTRTALLKLYLMMGISRDEHLLHSNRPQCRLKEKIEKKSLNKKSLFLSKRNPSFFHVFSHHLKRDFLSNSYQWCFLVVMPNFVPHSSQHSPSPHLGSALNESKSLKRSCLVATWQLKIEVPLWFKVPKVAPALTSDRHMAPLPFMYARSKAEKKNIFEHVLSWLGHPVVFIYPYFHLNPSCPRDNLACIRGTDRKWPLHSR